MKKFILILLALSLVVVVAACGQDDKTITMGFVPSQDAANIADTAKPLADKLSEILGVPVKAEVMTDYVGLVEAMRTEQVDIGFLPPFAFVQAEERAQVEVVLKAIRNGSDSYRAQYNVRADLDVQTVEDLVNAEGLRWAYGDTNSTSGYLFPASHLMDLGITDLDAHFDQMAVGGHDNALIALLNNDADVATTFEDARTRIQDQYPNVMEDIRVIGFTTPIPNDTISVRKGMDAKLKQQIVDAFLGFNDDAEMLEVLDAVYNWTGIAAAQSADYDVVRSTYQRFEDQLN